MKRLFTLIALVVLTINADAQRTCNLVFTSITYTHGGSYGDSSLVPFYATVKNMGPDSLKTTDTMAFFLVLWDPYINNYNYSTNGVITWGNHMAIGDSITFYDTSGTLVIPTYHWIHPSDSTANLCLNVFGISGGSDSIKLDTATASLACIPVTYLDIHQQAIAKNGLKLYPNPAKTELNFDINLNKSGDLSIRILDMLGRTVITENAGMSNAGSHKITLNTGSLNDGIYIYQVIVGSEATTGRFNIIK